MRTVRYVVASLLLVLTLTANAVEPRERATRQRSIFDKIIIAIQFVLQPLSDGLIPPHP
jgi:hypothetical protein